MALLVAFVVMVVSLLAAISIGVTHLSPIEVWQILLRHMGIQWGPKPSVLHDTVVWTFRAPRSVLAVLAGAGLAGAGLVLQTVVRNPLADPYVLGAAQGAGLGAVLVIVLGSGATFGLGVSSAAFVGALVSLVCVFALGRQAGRFEPMRLVLAGVAFGYVFSSAVSFLEMRVANSQQLTAVVFWLLGSVSGAKWTQLPVLAAAVVIGLVWLLVRAPFMDALLTGDETAASLGVPVSRFRGELVIVASLLTGAVIAVSGGIGFVGLVIPHAVRFVVGGRHRRLLPMSMLVGASFLVWCDVVARTVAPPVEIPIGVITSAIGAPFFLWLMHRNRNVVAR